MDTKTCPSCGGSGYNSMSGVIPGSQKNAHACMTCGGKGWVYKTAQEKEKDGCYLSEACCSFAGLPDDCPQLATLRKFRDQHLLETREGRELVDRYYQIAPGLVEKIETSPEPEGHWSFVLEQIHDVVALIQKGQNAEAISRYKAMTEALSRQMSPQLRR